MNDTQATLPTGQATETAMQPLWDDDEIADKVAKVSTPSPRAKYPQEWVEDSDVMALPTEMRDEMYAKLASVTTERDALKRELSFVLAELMQLHNLYCGGAAAEDLARFQELTGSAEGDA